MSATLSEQHVIGAMILEPSIYAELASTLNVEDFTSPKHRAAYRCISEIAPRGSFDEAMLATALGGGTATADSLEYVASLVEAVPSAVEYRAHAHAIIAEAKKRKLVAACKRIIQEAESLTFYSKADAEAWFTEAASTLHVPATIESSNIVTARQAIKQVMNDLQARHERKGQLPGIPTGFQQIDDYLLGLQRGNLVVLAGKPGAGKTALALNIAANAAKAGNATLVCSHEMLVRELMSRLLMSDARIPGVVMETGNLQAEHFGRLEPAAGRIGSTPLFLADTPPKTIPALMAEAQTMKRRHELQLLVVDYLQLMDAAERRANREQAVSEISRGLKRIAMELGICVLALSQLNRQTDRNSEPHLSELRDSGSIEQDANSVVMIWAEKDDAPTVNGKVAKNRSGQIGKFQLTFKRAIQRFE